MGARNTTHGHRAKPAVLPNLPGEWGKFSLLPETQLQSPTKAGLLQKVPSHSRSSDSLLFQRESTLSTLERSVARSKSTPCPPMHLSSM